MSSASLRRRLVEFLIQSATGLHLPPMVKYSALSLFAHRFFPSLSTSSPPSSTHWLLSKPVRESNLQLFALISLWISSKSHGFGSLALPSLKTLADRLITDQIFTRADFLQGEIVFMRSPSFQIGTSMTAFPVLEELLFKFRAVAITGKLISFEACLEIMDLLYETEESSELGGIPVVGLARCLCSRLCVCDHCSKAELGISGAALGEIRHLLPRRGDYVGCQAHSPTHFGRFKLCMNDCKLC